MTYLKKRIPLFFLVLITFFIKLIFGYFIPIVGDESYYWFWGQNLQLSYFDHPGMVAWLASLTDYLSFLPTWMALRFIFVVLSTMTFCIWLKVFIDLRFLRQEKSLALEQPIYFSQIIWFTIFYNLNPLLGIGGIFVTPDAPLLFFWGLSSLKVQSIIKNNKTKDFIWLGLFLGLGFCSKYHIVLFPLVTLISLYYSNQLKLIKDKRLIFTVLSGLIFSLPVLIWNWKNDFASFQFQLEHGFKAHKSYSSWWTTTYILGQVLLFGPILLFAQKNKIMQPSTWQWAFFLYSSFKAKVEANWPITAHSSALTSIDYSQKKTVKWALIYSLTIWISISLYFLLGFADKKIKSYPSSLVVTNLIPQIKNYKPLYGPTYQMASLIHLFTGEIVYKLPTLSRYDFYDSLEKAKPKFDKFYVLKYAETTWPNTYNNYNLKLIHTFSDYEFELYEFTKKNLNQESPRE